MANSAILQRSAFSNDFVWGVSSSAYQYEGAADKYGRGASIWDTFTHKWPGKMMDGSNGTTAIDFYHRYKEDIKILKDIGFNAFRVSISWSRILPSGKISGGKNHEGIQFYHDLFDELLLNGITPFVTLFHWDLPQALESEYKGFLSTQIVPDFCDYAELCFWEYGGKVKNWITLNEPWSYCTGGYVTGGLAPGRGPASSTPLSSSVVPRNPSPEDENFVGIRTHRVYISKPCKEGSSDPGNPGTEPLFKLCKEGSSDTGNPGTEPYIVARNQLLSHAAAVKLYKDNFQDCQKGQIGISLVSNWFEPLDPRSTKDIRAAERARDFMLGWFMEPLINGIYPQSMQENVDKNRLTSLKDKDYPYEVKGSYDFIGVNYYTAQYVLDSPKSPSDKKLSYTTDQQLKTTYYRGNEPIGKKSGSDWLYIFPKGISKLLEWIAETYGKKKSSCDDDLVIYITENGVCELDDVRKTIKDARLDADMRSEYHNDHIEKLNEGMNLIKKSRVKVKGYFAWSLLDNYEWPGGYKIRFGLIYVDYKDGHLARYPKESATWFMNFLKGDGCKTQITK